MKAVIQGRARTLNRPFLPDFIPLKTPSIASLDPSDKCNLKCDFCPTGDHDLMRSTIGRNYGPMTFETFTKAIDGCKYFPQKVKVFRLYKDGEPLSNPRFVDMVSYAKQSGYSEIIDTTTNALFLNPQRNREIITAGLDRLNISIYGLTSEQYEAFCGRKINFNKLVENISDFYERSRDKCVINIKINGDVISEADQEKFYTIFGDICDEINIEHIMQCWSNFDFSKNGLSVNKDLGIYGQPISERLVCPYIFYSFSVNSDGTVSACFLDWKRELVVGNINEETLPQIWNGFKMNEHRKMMLRGERKCHQTCGNCGQMTHATYDNIDQFRKTLLERID